MSNLIHDAKKEVIKLEKMMLKIDDFLRNAPEGCLKWQNRRKKTYYYQQYKQMEDTKNADGARENEKSISGKWNRRYITNENISLANCLRKNIIMPR